MIEDPEQPRGRRRSPGLSPATEARPERAGAADVPPAAPPPLDEWDVGESEVGWAAVAPPPEVLHADTDPDHTRPDHTGVDHTVAHRTVAGADTDEPDADAVDRRRGHDARPLLLRVLRPWFEPRPGELRGAIVLLAVALAASLALWFDASRRPPLPEPADTATAAPPATVPDAAAAPGAPGRADGSDGWGMGTSVGPVVHVSGAVHEPGVVTLTDGARVADAVAAAGGAMPDARLVLLNLARVVDDGERIHVPRVGEDAPPLPDPPSRGVLPDGRIDLNLASAEELETLPGVGPARAAAIITEREARPFRVPGDLRRVPGIGEATFQRLAPLVAVR